MYEFCEFYYFVRNKQKHNRVFTLINRSESTFVHIKSIQVNNFDLKSL